jgi:hypothetical protein
MDEWEWKTSPGPPHDRSFQVHGKVKREVLANAKFVAIERVCSRGIEGSIRT